MAEICFLEYQITTVPFWDEHGRMGGGLTTFLLQREADRVSASFSCLKNSHDHIKVAGTPSHRQLITQPRSQGSLLPALRRAGRREP